MATESGSALAEVLLPPWLLIQPAQRRQRQSANMASQFMAELGMEEDKDSSTIVQLNRLMLKDSPMLQATNVLGTVQLYNQFKRIYFVLSRPSIDCDG